jgi:hypothetical protein
LAGSAANCGKAVKTLTDEAAGSVDIDTRVATTVEALRRRKVPSFWSINSPRIAPVEMTTFHVSTLLLSMIREDDSDIHLVVADPKIGGSMIIEFPAFTCTTGAKPSLARTLMKKARKALADACGGEPTGTVVTLRGRATIDGVGFFDRVHRQGGVAPNGIELHPVLDFQSISCERVQP